MPENRRKILVIPPHPSYGAMKIRLIEIAKLLSDQYDVFLLDWQAVHGDYNLLSRIKVSLMDLFRKPAVKKSGSLMVVSLPNLHRPYKMALKFNSLWLQKFLEANCFDAVVNGSFSSFRINNKRDYKYIFDVCDYPFCGEKHYDQLVDENLKTQFKLADAVTVVSNGLVKYLKEKYAVKSIQIPNGAYIKKIMQTDSGQIEQIRKKYNLEGKWVIGYIGFIGEWVDVELLARAFKEVKKQIPSAALLLVGGWQGSLPKENLGEDVVVTGLVNDEIADYFALLDVGVLPHKKNIFQDLAFHLKIIEYSAARKIVVSSPIEAVTGLNFSNILTAQMKVSAWAETIIKAKTISWNPEWDGQILSYDWGKIKDQFITLIEGLVE